MIKALRSHFLPFLGLLLLLTSTAACAWLPLHDFSLPLELLFSAAQALVIAIFFMELRNTSILIRIAALVGILWLAILLMLPLADYFSRFAPSAWRGA